MIGSTARREHLRRPPERKVHRHFEERGEVDLFFLAVNRDLASSAVDETAHGHHS
jgi:hypothetical protein